MQLQSGASHHCLVTQSMLCCSCPSKPPYTLPCQASTDTSSLAMLPRSTSQGQLTHLGSSSSLLKSLGQLLLQGLHL